ncbi:hypothetical protein [Vibrio campbellii]|uniref:hypothetical protein n=1 Tax=Vibrio campbellii TaxID=680 RepID=UPI000CD35C2D|nr:hypothetical protein [Vibrio campbellii]AUW02635.1 hypothetical protein C1N51_01995 [Vibrio campbellii]
MIINKKEKKGNKTLGEVIEHFSHDVNLSSLEEMRASLPVLQSLSNDLSWLADYARKFSIGDLSHNEINSGKFMTSNSYLIPTNTNKFVMRWNYWDSCDNNQSYESNKIKYAADAIHNHDFHLLTTCVLGPGYHSTIYKTEFEQKKLLLNQTVDLKPLGTHQLSCGEGMFMEAQREYHMQHLPSKPSVTVNIMVNNSFGEQYCLRKKNGQYSVSEILATNETRTEKINNAIVRFMHA